MDCNGNEQIKKENRNKRSCIMNTLSSNTMKVNRTHSVHFYWMLKKAGNVSKKLT